MAKERMERIIFSNYNLEDDYEEAKQFLMDKSEDGKEPSEDDIWEEIDLQSQSWWECEKMQLESFFHDRVFVPRGTCGRWDGNYDAGAIIRGFQSLYPAWKDCDYIKLYDVDGHFMVQATHHDGTNHYELRELNQKGLGFLERNERKMDDRKLHEALWKSTYSRLPNYAHLVFGNPKRQCA